MTNYNDYKFLAMYDFRGKQAYIYKTNKLKEVMGASLLMVNAFSKFRNEILEIKYNGKYEEVYEGGGNLLLLYKDKQNMLDANKEFDRMLLKQACGLKLIFSYCENTGDYNNDRDKLYQDNNFKKNTMQPQYINTLLPFTQIERLNSQPVCQKEDQNSRSRESVNKIRAYEELSGKEQHNDYSKFGDKGKDSMLAIIYCDGNKIGEKVKNSIYGKTKYGECIEAMKALSLELKEVFVDNPQKEFAKNGYDLRKILSAGDEITIVCRASDALKMMKNYFKALDDFNNNTSQGHIYNDYEACCGICIFHSNDPFSLAYNVAEECCEKAKNKSKQNGGGNYFDYHLAYSGLGNELDEVRKIQEKGISGRPYLVKDFSDPNSKFNKKLEQIKKLGRGNIKNLIQLITKSETYFELELHRLNVTKIKIENDFLVFDDKNTIFDIATVYDYWFDEKNGGNEECN